MRVTRLKCEYAERYQAKRQPNCGCLECANKWAAAGGSLITMQDFWIFCRSHDWFHEMSDDGRVHRAGAANMDYLKKLAKELGPEAEKILEQWTAHHYSGPQFQREKIEPPPFPY